jgi:hypothetical protein
VGKNKEELFQFLSENLINETSDLQIEVLSTQGEKVLTNKKVDHDTSLIEPCKQEEADTRMLLHAMDAALHGHQKLYIRTVDSDVVILAIHFFDKLKVSELWVGYGRGKTFRNIPIHEVVLHLSPLQCRGILFWHAFSGCDITSAFMGIGKKTAWSTWNSMCDQIS